MSNTAREWVIAVLLWCAVFVFLMWYHKVRGKPYSLWTANKCTANASAWLVGAALSLGPLTRLRASLGRFLSLRRPMGVLGGTLCVPHMAMSLFALPEKLPLSWYGDHPLAPVTGALVLVLLVTIAASSFPRVHRRLGRARWVRIQRASRGAGLILIAHLLTLGKIPGWIEWMQTINKPFPPGAFTTTTILVLVFVLRAAAAGAAERAGGHAEGPPDG